MNYKSKIKQAAALLLISGMLVNSISVMADAFNNLSDAASSVISFVGVKLAGRPADKEHPFGHGRYEYITAFIVSFLVLQVGFSCFKSSIGKIVHPEEVAFQLPVVLILTVTNLMKISQNRYVHNSSIYHRWE